MKYLMQEVIDEEKGGKDLYQELMRLSRPCGYSYYRYRDRENSNLRLLEGTIIDMSTEVSIISDLKFFYKCYTHETHRIETVEEYESYDENKEDLKLSKLASRDGKLIWEYLTKEKEVKEESPSKKIKELKDNEDKKVDVNKNKEDKKVERFELDGLHIFVFIVIIMTILVILKF